VNQKVSVIIPAYNAERSISSCLNSILDQRFPDEDLEIIVVDNNSNDDTVLICGDFDVRIVKEPRQGRSFARNTGAKVSTGNYLAFIDSDVILEPDWLKNCLLCFRTKHIGGVQGRIVPTNHDGRYALNKFRHREVKKGTKASFILLEVEAYESPMINSAACIYRKEAFESVKGFDEQLERHEDIDLSRRVVIMGYDLASTDLATANVVYHGSGWLSYFARSFRHGLTKKDYLSKWSKYSYINNRPKNNNESNLDEKLESSTAKSEGYNYNITAALDETVGNLIRTIIHLDFYYFLSFISCTCVILGKVWGIFFRKSQLELNFEVGHELSNRVMTVNGIEYKHNSNFRYIFNKEKTAYFDIETNLTKTISAPEIAHCVRENFYFNIDEYQLNSLREGQFIEE
jgi:glycosyltransferase involved in cell wall biosynthesis